MSEADGLAASFDLAKPRSAGGERRRQTWKWDARLYCDKVTRLLARLRQMGILLQPRSGRLIETGS